MWKMGACIALSAAMTLTSTGGMLPSDWGIETVYADETQTTAKTFTAEQLEVIWEMQSINLRMDNGSFPLQINMIR